ncbi:CHAT domain-containing protein [Lactarius quietus]|nr:CHAT domain-containing protein [Lactarius quietus]
MATSLAASEINKGILEYQRLLASSHRSDPLRPIILLRLATRRKERFLFSHQKGDLDKSITYLTEAILLTSQIVVRLQAFVFLASALLLRFSFCEQPEDINSSVKYFRFLRINYHALGPFNIPHCQFTQLMIRALARHLMLESSDMIQDIKEMAALTHGLLSSDVSTSDLIPVIDIFYEAVTNTFHLDEAKLPPEKVAQVLREVEMILPQSPGSHSEFDSNLPKIEKDILKCRRLLASTPRSHPYRPPLLRGLGIQTHLRSQLSPQKDDLDGSITNFTEAILLSFRTSRVVAHMFYELASLLLRRFIFFKQPEDAESTVKYFRFLQVNFQPLEAFGILHGDWIYRLFVALALSLVFGYGDMTQDLEEMVTLIPEVLVSAEVSTENSWSANTYFIVAATTTEMFSRKETQEIAERVIRLLRGATLLKPDSQNASFALASCLADRFQSTHVIDDYEEAIAIADKVVAVESPGDGLTEMQKEAIMLIRRLLVSRLNSYLRPAYLEDAIHRIRTLLCFPNLPDHHHKQLTSTLEVYEGWRSHYFGATENSREGPDAGYSRDGPQVIPGSLMIERVGRLRDILTTIQTGEMADIEAAVECSRTLLLERQSSDQWSFLPTSEFADILLCAHDRTNRLDYLNEAIITCRKLREAATPKATHFRANCMLLACHGALVRSSSYDLREDVEERMQLFLEVANDGSGEVFRRLKISCSWAGLARVYGHPSVSTAYETSMSLMQETLVFSPTLQTQHFHLARMPKEVMRLPSDYASYQIDAGQIKQAIEALERGRALLWSEMRGLRTSTDQLRADDPPLADKLADINQRLESVTMSVAQSESKAIGDDRTITGRHEGMDWIGRLVTTQQRLLEERETLISHIQSLPGLQNFLKPPSFDILNSAAAQGPLIIICQSQLRFPSYIIILLKDSPPSVIPTPPNFHDCANQLKDDLLHIRKEKGLDSNDYDLTLASVLSDLYELVGKSVIEKLNQLEVPKGSRVWWCPTGDFCSLPLHALGPIPSDDGGNDVYFSDIYIPSYTPTLSALIESRKPGLASIASDNLVKPSILLVAQPETLPGAWGEIGVIQAAKTSVTTLISAMATPRTVIEGLRHHRFAHFVCHGQLETGKPFDASLELHGDNLTLLEIVRSQLPAAELAFLSACHTAELTEDSVDDEALHLAAAMQYCGFRSVVGTMWAMADTDGTDLAKHFYKAIFSEKAGQNGVPHHERSARALHVAVKKLRRNRGISLERWVNFVHYGA